MKSQTKLGGLFGAIAIAGLSFLSACQKTEVAEPDSTYQTKEVLERGPWRISSFQWHDRAQEKENNDHFVSYTFRFDALGKIIAYHNNIVEYGKWGNAGNNIISIDFGSVRPLYELNNKRWRISERTPAHIVLSGMSPYDSSSEFLIFEKLSSLSD